MGISSKILGEMSESPFADAVEQRRFRVLVVDDEPSIRRLLRAFFEQHSYEVDTADGGEKALELVRRHAYDLVLRHGLDIAGDCLCFGTTTGNVYLSNFKYIL